mgnify:CR=1 FL=1
MLSLRKSRSDTGLAPLLPWQCEHLLLKFDLAAAMPSLASATTHVALEALSVTLMKPPVALWEACKVRGVWPSRPKGVEALVWLNKNQKKFNYFWHQEDDFTLTSEGYIWTYPGKELSENSICVMPERNMAPDALVNFNQNCYGVCSDYVGLMNKNI